MNKPKVIKRGVMVLPLIISIFSFQNVPFTVGSSVFVPFCTTNGNNKRSVVPCTTSSDEGPEKYLWRRNREQPTLTRAKPSYSLAPYESFSGFHQQDEDTTLRLISL